MKKTTVLTPHLGISFDTKIGTDHALATQWLLTGECVAIPTETVYGLAANALDVAAVVKIFEVKNRPTFDPLIVHIPNQQVIEQYVTEFPAPLRQLADRFWPGPLTLLLPKRDIVPDLTTSGLPRVAIRVPDHPVILKMLQCLPFPLAAPSANPFGYISPTTAQHVYDQLQERIPYILDGGSCTIGIESTIVGYEAGQVVVYRLGGLPIEAIEAVVGKVSVQANQSNNPAAPGMLESHYAPRKPLYLTNEAIDKAKSAGKRIGLLSFNPVPHCPVTCINIALSDHSDLTEAAQNLFAALRALDASDIDIIVAEILPDIGLGRAVNDRLRRAAVQDV